MIVVAVFDRTERTSYSFINYACFVDSEIERCIYELRCE
jgi:hypothetical protein